MLPSLSLTDMVLKPAHLDRAGKLKYYSFEATRKNVSSQHGRPLHQRPDSSTHALRKSQRQVVSSEASRPHHSQIPANFATSVNKGAAHCLSDFWKIFLNEKEDITIPMNSGGERACSQAGTAI